MCDPLRFILNVMIYFLNSTAELQMYDYLSKFMDVIFIASPTPTSFYFRRDKLVLGKAIYM